MHQRHGPGVSHAFSPRKRTFSAGYLFADLGPYKSKKLKNGGGEGPFGFIVNELHINKAK